MAGRRRGWEHRGRHVSSCRRVVLNDAPGRLHRAAGDVRDHEDRSADDLGHSRDRRSDPSDRRRDRRATQVVAPHAPLLAIGAAKLESISPPTVYTGFNATRCTTSSAVSIPRSGMSITHWWRPCSCGSPPPSSASRLGRYVCALPSLGQWPTSTVGVNAHPATEATRPA